MKNKKTLIDYWEVWTTFPNTGRPNTLIEVFENKDDANTYAS